MKKWATFSKLRSPEKLYHFSRKTTEFLVIAKCRNGPLSVNYHRRKTLPFLKKNYTISRDHKMKEWATFYKLQSQENPDHFSRETIQFLVIPNSRNGPLSANNDRKKTAPFLKKNHTISRDRELQKWATFCKFRSQEKLDHFSRKTIQFLEITK